MLQSSIVKLKSNIVATKIFRNYATNLYDILGLTPHATQADIKSAYYKLSKAHHPDLNPDDAVASEKFRKITEAYEVLGTYRIRKMYDKGLIHRAGSQFSHHAKPSQRTQPYDLGNEIDDDETTKFYKSRLRREHTGKSKIYDFDEWTQQHYGDTFRLQQESKSRESFKRKREDTASSFKISRNTLVAILALGACFVSIAELITNYNTFDVDNLGKEK